MEESTPSVKEEGARKPCAVYVDGFNLYHAIKDLQRPYLKWINLWKLAEIIIPKASEKLARVVFCTAYYPGNEQKRWRHDQYLNALKAVGVECVKGHYVHEDAKCLGCGDKWQKPTEKETDINVALSLMNDAWAGIYEKAYLISGDSDQAATARCFRELFPKKELISVATPGRNFSFHILKYAHDKIQLNEGHLERALFPQIVLNPNGQSGRRPREYDPPPGWVPPDKRP